MNLLWMLVAFGAGTGGPPPTPPDVNHALSAMTAKPHGDVVQLHTPTKIGGGAC